MATEEDEYFASGVDAQGHYRTWEMMTMRGKRFGRSCGKNNYRILRGNDQKGYIEGRTC